MESQLPNITAATRFCTDNNGSNAVGCYYTRGAFYGTEKPNAYITDANAVGNEAGNLDLNLDASRSSSIYKNGVTQVFTDSVAMNAWIKCKKMNIAI